MLSASAGPAEPAAIELPRLVRVLVVEDDFGDYDLVARALAKMRHFQAAATRANTLESARRLMAKHVYDVVLINYQLGLDCGVRLLQEIGGRGAAAVPILMTSLPDHEVQEIALRAGAIGCIHKCDISPTLLETTIRYALYTHRIEGQISGMLHALASRGGNVMPAETLLSIARQMPWLARRGQRDVAHPMPALAAVTPQQA